MALRPEHMFSARPQGQPAAKTAEKADADLRAIYLRGRSQLCQAQWQLAAATFAEALQMRPASQHVRAGYWRT